MKNLRMLLLAIVAMVCNAGVTEKKLFWCEIAHVCDSLPADELIKKIEEIDFSDKSLNLNPFQMHDGKIPKEIAIRKFKETNCDACWQLTVALNKLEDKCIERIRQDFPTISHNFAIKLAKKYG